MALLKVCCPSTNFKNESLKYGVFTMMVAMGIILVGAILLVSKSDEDMKREGFVEEAIFITGAIIDIIVSIILLVGVWRGKDSLMFPWIVFRLAVLVLILCFMIYDRIQIGWTNSPKIMWYLGYGYIVAMTIQSILYVTTHWMDLRGYNMELDNT